MTGHLEISKHLKPLVLLFAVLFKQKVCVTGEKKKFASLLSYSWQNLGFICNRSLPPPTHDPPPPSNYIGGLLIKSGPSLTQL